jgi:hypothetical protein
MLIRCVIFRSKLTTGGYFSSLPLASTPDRTRNRTLTLTSATACTQTPTAASAVTATSTLRVKVGVTYRAIAVK